jgi:hypothetical protein
MSDTFLELIRRMGIHGISGLAYNWAKAHKRKNASITPDLSRGLQNARRTLGFSPKMDTKNYLNLYHLK